LPSIENIVKTAVNWFEPEANRIQIRVKPESPSLK